MDIEESEVFEITDYTNVTDWEKFISKIEEIFTTLENSQIVENVNKIETQRIYFQKFELNINLFQPNLKILDNSLNFNNETNSIEITDSLIVHQDKDRLFDYEHEIHWELVKWFGKRKFIVFSPSRSTSIYGQDQINQLISSITIAAINIKCQLPILVKYGPKNWPLYIGIQFDNDLKSKLQCAMIKYTPKQCTNLSGIRRIFQEKLGKGFVFNDDVVLTAKYLYIIDNCPHKNENYFKGLLRSAKKKMHFFQYMSPGFGKDPIKNMKIFVHWSKVPKHVLINSEQSLPLSSATCWYLICESENSYDGILYKTLRKLLKSFLVAQKSSEILQDMKSQDIDTMHINQPLLKLTNYPISNHHLFEKSFGHQTEAAKTSGNSGQKTPELLEGKVLNDILLFIFPDASQSSKDWLRQPYSTHDGDNIPNFRKLQKRFPNANMTFLIHRLAVCLTNMLSYHKEGMKCFSFLWREVVLELRYRLENCIPLSDTRMSDDFKLIENENIEHKDEVFARLLRESMPHLGSSQLEQRLQLINYCILVRLRNQSLQKFDNTLSMDTSGLLFTEKTDCDSVFGSLENEDSMEQFFDCETDNDNELFTSTISKMAQEPRGRLRKFDDNNLLNHPDIPLYVPITQVLSVDIYSSSKQAKHDKSLESLENYHAASLIADMSAFKAANPGCEVHDFIRWYSPKDFIEHEDQSTDTSSTNSPVKGQLSSRMLVTDNTWLKSWESAIPIPARLQKRLFDDTIAAETALKWMENLTTAEISSSIINNVLIDSLNALVECVDDQDPPEFLQQIDSASQAIVKFYDNIDIMDVTGSELEFYQMYDELISHFQRIEYSLAVKKSLHHKFLTDFSGSTSDKQQIISVINRLLVSYYEVAISTQALSTVSYKHIMNRVTLMYKISSSLDRQEPHQSLDQIFTKTNQKEYTLSLNCSYPFPTSRKSNQRMYVCSSDDEFLIATNFCEDITYF